MLLCCRWYLAPVCWLDNVNHARRWHLDWICDLHDWVITRGYR